jgi:hypothetical protein
VSQLVIAPDVVCLVERSKALRNEALPTLQVFIGGVLRSAPEKLLLRVLMAFLLHDGMNRLKKQLKVMLVGQVAVKELISCPYTRFKHLAGL